MRERACGLVLLTLVCCALAVVWLVSSPPGASSASFASSHVDSIHGVRSLAKFAVATEVCEGRMSMPEAAAVFEWLNRLHPSVPAEAALSQKGAVVEDEFRTLARSEEDCLCLQVLVYALPHSTPEREAELKAEYRRARATSGGTSLPAVIEPDCHELMVRARSTWSVCRSGGCESDARVSLGGLRLTEPRRE